MNSILTFPFFYFYFSRIKKSGSIFFNFLFEWIPYIIIIIFFSKNTFLISILYLFLSYIAFISFYELGYIVNDYFSINFEENGNNRAPISGNRTNISFWIFSRLIIFIMISYLLPFGGTYGWNISYIILGVFFAAHNLIKVTEFKSISFFWLALLKYIIPIMFLINEESISSLILVSSTIYVPFRFLSYLESKKLLVMNKRKSILFRTFYFCSPLIFAAFINILPDFYLYFSLSLYYALIILVYFFISKLKFNKKNFYFLGKKME